MAIAVALGGGAALGWAHIGVLRALQDHGIPVRAAAGTSIGALAAVAFAAGKLDPLERIARSANWLRVLSYLDIHFRPGAMLGGRGILRDLEMHFARLQFQELLIPSCAVACDLVSGKPVIIDRGPVNPAIMASIAIPGLFRPVQFDGQFLVDGGVVMPVPVAAARAIAPKLPVLSVNLQGDYHGRRVASAIRARPARNHPSMAVVRASTMLLMAELARHSLALDPPDYALTLPVGHVEIHDFTRADELIAIGRQSVIDHLADIRALVGRPPRPASRRW
ncbi:patatin-like phospholipase family protein [Sphingomonadaceae bacterium G21617-S1]|jgi:NTE family protein|uniref:patatin-like phospholipase family protein n=1 Tax=Rhizorhabdus sp. TaxID=1968843 RepID=UPI0019B7565D|nr:patatin-like phospholipase family protein [Rhizorhabdus sp.]MBD3760610.1 patatin-like phospholipase family protein [Rhizorhabdus sp.]MCZ4339997.1 patatin-like phospholipase family protein [Sphingomonadaceae bacterium G21617-S1]